MDNRCDNTSKTGIPHNINLINDSTAADELMLQMAI